MRCYLFLLAILIIFFKNVVRWTTLMTTLSDSDFKLSTSQVQASRLEIQKLNEVVRMLNTDITKAIEFAQETQDIEREIDTKYRTATIVTLDKISNVKEVLLVKDVIESIEEMADKCQKVSDTFIMLALSL